MSKWTTVNSSDFKAMNGCVGRIEPGDPGPQGFELYQIYFMNPMGGKK